MLGDLIKASTKKFGSSFSLLNVLPGVLVVTVIAVIARAHMYDLQKSPDFGEVLPGKEDTAAAILFTFGAFLGGVLLRPFEVRLVQVLEGYWSAAAPVGALRAMASERHRRRRDNAALKRLATVQRGIASRTDRATLSELALRQRARARADRIQQQAMATFQDYPERDVDIMPTLLGNILRDAEYVAGHRYGLDVRLAYPRMFPTVSAPMQMAIKRQLDLITISASLTVCFGLIAIASLPLTLRLDLWSLTAPLATALATIAYRGAASASREHKLILMAVFDLHRFDLATAFHYELPPTAAQELTLNKQLNDFLHDPKLDLTKSDTKALGDASSDLAERPFDHPVSCHCCSAGRGGQNGSN
ncbi:hypothetical protein QF026_002410 [Streptomyces aurantiacus]|uniref:hypothetical protein n=1 Tax=Streptomyces aurantiacus TaxID=47760 RepID=UPI002794A96B|nr:hypothetical protein [Streptomyces aurantiacus]MDQ0773944.1 hypothetical protein [Streptomyces aurantiacus]